MVTTQFPNTKLAILVYFKPDNMEKTLKSFANLAQQFMKEREEHYGDPTSEFTQSQIASDVTLISRLTPQQKHVVQTYINEFYNLFPPPLGGRVTA